MYGGSTGSGPHATQAPESKKPHKMSAAWQSETRMRPGAWTDYAHPSGPFDPRDEPRAVRLSAAPERPRSGGFLLEALDGLQHLVDVTGDLDATPLTHQDAGRADQEGRAFDALDLLAVHDLVLDHAEHVAELLFGVGNQLEGQFQGLLEFFMRGHVVARNAQHHGAGLHEILVAVAELHGLGGTTRRVVFRIEIQHDRLAQEGVGSELHAAGGLGLNFRQGFVERRRHWGVRQVGLAGSPGRERCCAATHAGARRQ
mmetsp:Transcript_12848/g.30054  ORF Transcript_12848/g.30054 Transcript_12848/m.30054 type:complete len:257 (+) Transcript_12848:1446-2216(+)